MYRIQTMCLFFRVEPSVDESLSTLSARQRRLVTSAINYHSLIQPGRTLRYKIYMGEKWQYPRLTDTTTIDGGCTAAVSMEPILEFEASSTVETESEFSPHYCVGGRQLIDTNDRYILLTPDDASDDDVAEHRPMDSTKARIYKKFEKTAPVAFDYVREVLRREREHQGTLKIETFYPQTVARHNEYMEGFGPVVQEVAPREHKPSAPRAVIIAMHWLQAGGAERWGMETIALAKEADLLPIVITDRDSHQPWITDPACDGALVLPLTQPLQQRLGDEPILRALFEQFDIRAVLIHHCQWMYDRLWWVKRYFPETATVDSLHIVEHVMQGGYPRESVARDESIDLHHVISPQLERWMVDTHHIDAAKVVDAPLVGLTAHSHDVHYRPRSAGQPLTVAFVGRIARQKRPEAFVLLANRLSQHHPGEYRFIMHGDGDMDAYVDGLIVRHGLEGVIERRSSDVPVAQTYADCDVLVVSSINEGITLTTIEAISAGIPVLSADVGSQSTLVPVQGLLPRLTAAFVGTATRSLEHIQSNETDRQRLWDAELQRLQDFSQLQSADDLFRGLFKKWSA